MSSNDTEDATLITDDSIITMFKVYKEDYTVFTTQSKVNEFKYQSIIKFSKYNKIALSGSNKPPNFSTDASELTWVHHVCNSSDRFSCLNVFM